MNRRRLVLTCRFAFGVTAIVLAVGIAYPLITASGDIGSRVRELTVVFASMGYSDLKYLTADGAARSNVRYDFGKRIRCGLLDRVGS